MAKCKLLVLFGGAASEYAESLQTASAVLRILPEEKYEVIPIGVNKNGRWLYFPGDYSEIGDGSWVNNPDCTSAILSPDPAHRGILILEDGAYTFKRIDVIFSLLRGHFGEDGSIQGLCELSHIPYVGNGLLGSALCRNKAITHSVLSAANIAMPHWIAVSQRNINRLDKECDKIEAVLDYPMYVKPACNDSDIASGIAENRQTLITMLKRGFTQDGTVLVEEYIIGREFRIAVFGYDLPFASFVGEITEHGSDAVIVPAPNLDDTTVQIIREIALSAFAALGCKALALFDFYCTERGDILLGEVNTMPALAPESAYPTLMADLGMRYPYLIEKLIEQAADHADHGL